MAGAALSVYRGTLGAGGLWWLYVGIGVCSVIGSIAQLELMVAGLVAVATGLLSLLPLSRWRQTLTIREDGLAWRGLLRERFVPREQVLGARSEWHQGEMSTWSELVVLLPLGRALKLRGLAETPRAAAEIAAFVALAAPVGPAPGPALFGRRG